MVEQPHIRSSNEEFVPEEYELRPLDKVLRERRATQHFDQIEVREEALRQVLFAGSLAPSGYNLQPWRFIVVRDAQKRRDLMKASMDQPKVQEAPVVIIALGMKEQSKKLMHEIFLQGVYNGVGDREKLKDQERQALQFLEQIPSEVWVNRHTMIAVTTMMLFAESLGIDTAPMEGFDADKVKESFGIPDEAEVVCLLALGHAKQPDKKFPGRLALDEICYGDHYGRPLKI